MTAHIGRLPTSALLAAVLFASLTTLSGCAEFSEWMSFDSSGKAEAKAKADAASLWEMTLMAGRYGVMLDQAREILNLPEPKPGASFPAGHVEDAAQRKALAQYQVGVVKEFAADVAHACKRKRVPQSVRKVACGQSGVPAELGAPAETDLAALSARNDKVGDVVTPWWNAVCATTPKPKDGDVPPCAME